METTQSESPIKAWVRKHSPLKSRNKPLPPPPPAQRHGSPIRKPVHPVSGNAAAPPPMSTRYKQPKEEQLQQPRRRLSGFLTRNRSHDDSLVSYKRSKTPSQDEAYRISRAKHAPSGRGSPKPSANSINRLNEKVSSLEAQLIEARREIQNLNRRAPSPFEYNRLIEARQASLTDSRRYEGLVENLLDVKTRAGHQQAHTGPYDSRSFTRMRASSADISDYRNRPTIRSTSYGGMTFSDREQYHHDRDDYDVFQSAPAPITADSPNTLKRKRSELRAAEWLRIQQHMAGQPDVRPSQRQKKHHDRELPKTPKEGDEGKQETSAEIVSQPQQQTHRQTRVSKMPYSRTKQSENVEVFNDEQDEYAQDEEELARPPSSHRRHVTSPSRLDKIQEEYEWDEDIF